MNRLNAMFAALLVGAMLGLVLAHLANASLLGGLGIGAVVGFIIGFAFMSLPAMDKEPKDLYPED